ncbi:MAG: hypothetical protein B7Y45_03500 [Sphingomonas sp. 28-66-16]|nr:MAG: hypothetical protein B7Y45_03500 [Sphingomonas sp. 28-66-16]
MRGAMICVSVMLAILQLWPMVFGRQASTFPSSEAAQIAPAERAKMVPAVAAGAMSAPVMTIKAVEKAPKTDCYKQYTDAFQKCSPGNGQCRMAAADLWDLCEATGFWPAP